MPNPSFLGYLDAPYLDDPYLGGTGFHAWGMEVNLVIDSTKVAAMEVLRNVVDFTAPFGSEVQRNISDALMPIGSEVQRTIDSTHVIGMEVDRLTVASDYRGMEVARLVDDFLNVTGSEAELTIESSGLKGSEVARFVQGFPASTGMEVNRQILDTFRSVAMEVRRDQSMASWLCEELGYLEQPYLGEPYLVAGICAQMGAEVARVLFKTPATGMEVHRTINSSKPQGMEVLRQIVDAPHAVGMEANRLSSAKIGMQVRLVLYNTNRLRILVEFPSRGTSGLNWTASSTAAGDFNVNNLNTDIVEERWQSLNGDTSIILTSDTEVVQGVPVDTVAILNHNLTSSASITVEGSNSPIFSPVDQTFTMVPTKNNAYYIAPTFPTVQSRYWRFIINDSTNPATNIKIGTIVFGTTVIFFGECFVDAVTRRNRHFADKVATEGFTNVSNDRAVKRAVALEFRNLGYTRGNFANLIDIFDFVRTNLKALWIPDPQDPPRFAVFGKLLQIPDEVHNNLGPEASDTVDLSLEVDESQ